MAYRKFSLDCHNKRWMLGGGFAPTITEKKETTSFVDPGNEGAINYLSSDASSKGGGNICLRFAVAREKVYKNGSLLHAEFLVSLSPGVLGTATVRYAADGKEGPGPALHRIDGGRRFKDPPPRPAGFAGKHDVSRHHRRNPP